MRVLMLNLAVLSVMSGAGMTSQKDAPPGKVPFERVCATCHGPNAEGAQGPKIAGIEIEYEEFLAKVRHGGGEMPAISQSQMTDEEVKQVFDYLQSL